MKNDHRKVAKIPRMVGHMKAVHRQSVLLSAVIRKKKTGGSRVRARHRTNTGTGRETAKITGERQQRQSGNRPSGEPPGKTPWEHPRWEHVQ